MHEAVTSLPPTSAPLTDIGFVEELAQLLLPTLTAAGSEEHQVSGTPVRVVPSVSVTVAVMLALEPLLMEMAFPEPPETAKVTDLTGQVRKSTGLLVTPAVDAEIWVIPGVLAVACTWLLSSPLAPVFNFTTAVSACVQVNGPTVGVTSIP